MKILLTLGLFFFGYSFAANQRFKSKYDGKGYGHLLLDPDKQRFLKSMPSSKQIVNTDHLCNSGGVGCYEYKIASRKSFLLYLKHLYLYEKSCTVGIVVGGKAVRCGYNGYNSYKEFVTHIMIFHQSE